MPSLKKSEVFEQDLPILGMAYVKTKDDIKELERQCKEYREPLEKALLEKGRETSTGNKILVLEHGDTDVVLKHTLRVTKVLRAEAFDVLRELGHEECIESVPTIREDIVEKLFSAGEISQDDLARIYAPKESVAFSVSLKKTNIDEV